MVLVIVLWSGVPLGPDEEARAGPSSQDRGVLIAAVLQGNLAGETASELNSGMWGDSQAWGWGGVRQRQEWEALGRPWG